MQYVRETRFFKFCETSKMSSDGLTKGMYGKVFMLDAGIYQKHNRHITVTILKIDPKNRV